MGVAGQQVCGGDWRRLGCDAAVAGGDVWAAEHTALDRGHECNRELGRQQRDRDSRIHPMKRLSLALLLLVLAAWPAHAQPVTVVGPITPGDCAYFSSVTILKD